MIVLQQSLSILLILLLSFLPLTLSWPSSSKKKWNANTNGEYKEEEFRVLENNDRAVQVELDYEVRSSTTTTDPSTLYGEINNRFRDALYEGIGRHDGDHSATMTIQSVNSVRSSDCMEDITMPTTGSMACDMARMTVIVSLNRPQFDAKVAKQGIYDFAYEFFDTYTPAINHINDNTNILARMVYPISVTTRCRVGFREFPSTASITEVDRTVMTNAFASTISPILRNAPSPSFDIKHVSILMQDIRPEGLFQRRRRRRTRGNNRRTTTQTTTPSRMINSNSNVIFFSDFFVRGYCRITEPSCRDDAFNETLYSKLVRGDPNNNDMTGMEMYIQNLKLQGRSFDTSYFETVPAVQLFSAIDDYYDNFDIHDDQHLVKDIQHKDPDIHNYTGNIPTWLWLLVLSSIILLLVGIASLFCAQRHWENTELK